MRRLFFHTLIILILLFGGRLIFEIDRDVWSDHLFYSFWDWLQIAVLNFFAIIALILLFWIAIQKCDDEETDILQE